MTEKEKMLAGQLYNPADPELVAGQFVVRASADGYEPQSSNVLLDSDKTANFVLPPAEATPRVTIAGLVIDGAADRPIAGAVTHPDERALVRPDGARTVLDPTNPDSVVSLLEENACPS